MQHYDLIGDIHGHADELLKLLDHLGYRLTDTGHQHESRKVIFLGDFIDRGEHLRQHRKVLDTVTIMIENGHALAVMGNHEFNALAYHTVHEGNYLREHSLKNTRQHQAFLNEYDDNPTLKRAALDFFLELPLWLELDGMRVVHACWDDHQIDAMQKMTSNRRLDRALLVQASQKDSVAYHAIETLLKGVEVELPSGISFDDKDGNTRSAVRVQWWNDKAKRLGEVALPAGVSIGKASDLPVPDSFPAYTPENPPCFIGHYWLSGTPEPLSSNVACLDYSVARNGKLVAYRWSGEQVLTADHFVHL